MEYMTDVSRRGQSIIEALVALSILTVGLMGVLTLLSRSLLLQRETADTAKASYLASEGIEVVKSIIDNGVYTAVAQAPGVSEDAGWSGAVTGCFDFTPGAGSANYYFLDFETYSCPQGASPQAPWDQLYLGNGPNGTPRYYDSFDPNRPASAVATPFSRSVEVSRPDANTMDVISTVRWNEGSITGQSVTVEATFYNWHP